MNDQKSGGNRTAIVIVAVVLLLLVVPWVCGTALCAGARFIFYPTSDVEDAMPTPGPSAPPT